jgi:PAS domain S-box-containing protein
MSVRGAAVLSAAGSAAAIAAGGILESASGVAGLAGLAALGIPTGATILCAAVALAAALTGLRRVRLAAAGVVIASGVVALALDVRSGFDRTALSTTVAGLPLDILTPAPLTAVSFVFLGAAILALRHRMVEPLVAVPAALSFVVAAGYLFRSPDLTAIGTAVPMTAWAAAALMLLCVATLAAAPGAWFTALLASDTAAGLMARRLMPFAAVVPVTIGWVRLMGQRRGWYGTELGVAIYALTITIVLAAVVLVTTTQLEKIDRIRRGREREVETAEAKFRMLIERAPDAVVVADAGGTIQLVNATAETTFRYPREELIGQNVAMLLPDELRARHTDQMRGFHQSPSVRSMASGLDPLGMRKDGTRFHADIALSPIPTENGLLVIATVRDATQRRQMEQALRTSEARFRSIFEQVPVSILEQDWSGVVGALDELRAGGIADLRAWMAEHPERVRELLHAVRIVAVNSQTLAMFEADSAEEIAGSFDTILSSPEMLRGFAEQLAALDEGHATFRTEMALQTVKGNLIHVLLTMTLPPPEARQLPVLVTLMNITERHQAEAVLARRTAELERSNRELEQFAYVASHDLQEPLRMVASYTQLLEHRYRDQLDADAREFIAFAVDGANRMQCLINDLLSYSRVQTRGRPMTAVDSHKPLGRAVANLRMAIEETAALVTNDELPMVMADETQLAQLFQNLIGNGIKFRGSGTAPRIHISAVRRESDWVFSVRDNGIGIAPEFHQRIFVLFQRLHTRDDYPGTGIGLAICKRIVERHGGRIWVDSKPGQGSTFFFSLPAAA